MSTAMSDTATSEVEQYLKEVAPHLAGLPADERVDLLDDLAQHLGEIAAEPGPPLVERLGPPAAYAAELLASAGVIADGGPRPALLVRATSLVDRLRATWPVRELTRLWPVLHPAWWVLRAYLAVSLLAALQSDGSYPSFPFPRLGGNPFLGFVAVVAAVPLSVRLAQRAPRLPRSGRTAVVAANAVLVIYAFALMGRVGQSNVNYIRADGFPKPVPVASGCLTTATGDPITNLYAYDADGRLLDPVLLYDQNGQPIDNVCPDVDERGRRLNTEYRQDVNGTPVVNAFPRRQSASAGPLTAPTVPVKPPAVVVPRLGTTTTTTGG